MRILIDVTRHPSSGIGRYSWDLLKHLSAADCRNDYYALTTSDLEKYALRYASGSITTDSLPLSLESVYRSSNTISGLMDVFVATNFSTQLVPKIPTIRVVYDLIYVRNVHWQPTLDDLVSRHGQERIRTMTTDFLQMAKEYCEQFDGPWTDSIRNSKEAIVGDLFKYIYSYHIHSANGLIMMSDTVRREVRDYYPYASTKAKTIYPAVQKYPPPELKGSPDLYRSKDLQLLYVANIEPRKNHQLLLEALSHLRQEFQLNASLTLVGRPHYRSHFNSFESGLKQAADRSHVTLTFCENSRDLIRFYGAADLFVFPSLAEGFGLPLIEAMSLNVPTIALRTATTEEVCRDAVVYFESANPTDLALAIRELNESSLLKTQLAEKQKSRIKHFDGSLICNHFLQLLDRII